MTQPKGGEGGREGLFSALKNIVATLLAIGRTRAELLIVELEEEKLRFWALLSKAVAAGILLIIGVVLAVCCLAVALWEYRVLVFGIGAVLFIGASLLLIGGLKRQAAQPGKLFQASLHELDADLAALRRAGKLSE